MILNGHYIYVFPSGSHETEWYFTLTQQQTIYFAFLGATITIDDSTKIVTATTDPEITTANYSAFWGDSYTFSAGSHKVFIDSTDPSTPYTIYTRDRYASSPSSQGQRSMNPIYDTRVTGGYDRYSNTGRAIFYLANNYFSGNMAVVGRIPDYFFSPLSLGLYISYTYTSYYPAWYSMNVVFDITDVTEIGKNSLYGLKNSSTQAQGYINGVTINNISDCLKKVEIINDDGLNMAFAGQTLMNFDSLKKVGNNFTATIGSASVGTMDWRCPVLEETGSGCFGGQGLINNFTLPKIKKLGSSNFTNRARKANSAITGGPLVVHLGSSITSIGANCFITPEDYYDYAPKWNSVLKVYIDATTPPTVSNYAFYRYKGSQLYQADGNSIYVPSSRVTTYKNATYFSNFSSYIYAQ